MYIIYLYENKTIKPVEIDFSVKGELGKMMVGVNLNKGTL
jgi:hypothetical protein